MQSDTVTTPPLEEIIAVAHALESHILTQASKNRVTYTTATLDTRPAGFIRSSLSVLRLVAATCHAPISDTLEQH